LLAVEAFPTASTQAISRKLQWTIFWKQALQLVRFIAVLGLNLRNQTCFIAFS
jgi:hypothetical protein